MINRLLGEGLQNGKLLEFLIKRMGDKLDVIRGIADDTNIDMILDDVEIYWDEIKKVIVEFMGDTL